MGAKYETPEDAQAKVGGLMTHVHTTLNKLNTSFSYSTKFFSKELAEKFASIQQQVLKVLSDTKEEDITVQQFLNSL